MKLNILILSGLLAVGGSASAQIARSCTHLYHHLDARAENIYRMMSANLNTTGARIEEKRVVLLGDVESLQNEMRARGFKLRDIPPEGKFNVTVTDYLPDSKFTLDGKELKFKVRFRKYGTVDAKNPEGPWTPIESMKDVSTMEFKIERPDIKSSVIKRQLKIKDQDIALISNPSTYPKEVAGLRERLLQMNPKEAELVDLAMKEYQFRYKLHVKPGLDVQTRYVRNAWKLDLGNGQDMQATFDSYIVFHDYQTNETFHRYQPNETVSEVKIPPSFKSLTPEMIAKNPLLSDMSYVRKYVDEHHVETYKRDSGKSSSAKSRRKAVKEVSDQDRAE